MLTSPISHKTSPFLRFFHFRSLELLDPRSSSMVITEMSKALRAYGEVLRLVRRLPQDSRGYYAKYARENFVNYREVDPKDEAFLQDLLTRTYKHSLWVLEKYSVDESAANRLKEICSA